MKSTTKKIIIFITILAIVFILGGTYVLKKIISNKKAKEETEKSAEYIEGLPSHYLFYLEEKEVLDSPINIYDEKGNKVSKVKVDLVTTEVNLKDSYARTTQEKIYKNPTNLAKINRKIYGLYNNSIVLLAKSSAAKTVVSQEKVGSKILHMETIGTRDAVVIFTENKDLIYYNLSNNKRVVMNTYENKYSTNPKVEDDSKKEVLKLQADKDGIYCVYNTMFKKNVLCRYLISDQISSNNLKEISKDKISNFVKIDDWIYYTVEGEEGTLYRIFKDGTLKTKVITDFKKENIDKYNLKDYISGYIDTIIYVNNENVLKRNVVKTNEQIELDKDVKKINYNYGYVYYTKNNEDGIFLIVPSTNEIIKFKESSLDEYIILNEDLPN